MRFSGAFHDFLQEIKVIYKGKIVKSPKSAFEAASSQSSSRLPANSTLALAVRQVAVEPKKIKVRQALE
jgi:hypothetical protein